MKEATGVTILLCEDDEIVRGLYRKILELNGFAVIEAVDGDDAVAKYLENRDTIRIMVSDVIMPKKTGRQAYEEIKKTNGGIKVIFNSGYSSESTKKLQDDGFNYLQKPYEPQLLLAKIREVLAEESQV